MKRIMRWLFDYSAFDRPATAALFSLAWFMVGAGVIAVLLMDFWIALDTGAEHGPIAGFLTFIFLMACNIGFCFLAAKGIDE